MPLTPEEEAELLSLEQEIGGDGGGLSSEEEAELLALEQELEGEDQVPPQDGPSIHEQIQAGALGVGEAVSGGLAGALKVPGDLVADLAQGEKFGTTTDIREAQETAIVDRAPTEHTIGQGVGVAMTLGAAPALALGKGVAKAAPGVVQAGQQAASKAKSIVESTPEIVKVLVDIKLAGGAGTIRRYGMALARKIFKLATKAEKKGLPKKVRKAVDDAVEASAKDPTNIKKRDIFKLRSKPSRDQKGFKQ